MARTPLIPGHEFYGEVVTVGELVHDVQIGDRVSGEGHIPSAGSAATAAPGDASCASAPAAWVSNGTGRLPSTW